MNCSTHDIWIDLGYDQERKPIKLFNNGIKQTVSVHLYNWGNPFRVYDYRTVEVHWKTVDLGEGMFSEIDSAEKIKTYGNTISFCLPPDIMESRYTVLITISITDGETDCYCLNVPIIALQIKQIGIPEVDRNEICCPCIYARAICETETESKVEITVSGICESLVTSIALKYVLRPTKENEQISIPIEIGEYDLVNGHIYTITIPVAADYACRVVLNYVNPTGIAETEESEWIFSPCSVCGGIHTTDYH